MSFAQTLVYSVSAFSGLLLGIFAFSGDPRSLANRSFFLFTLSQFFWIASLYIGYSLSFQPQPDLEISILFFRAAFAFGILMISLLVVFFYFFPRITFTAPKWVKFLFVGTVSAAFVVSAFTPLVHESQYLVEGAYNDTDVYGPLFPYYNYLNLSLFLLSGIIAFRKLFALYGIEKKKIIIAAAGGWTFLLLATLTNVFLPLLGIWDESISKVVSFFRRSSKTNSRPLLLAKGAKPLATSFRNRLMEVFSFLI